MTSRLTKCVNGRSMTNSNGDELREFLLVLRRALLLIVRYIERRYNVTE